MVMEAPASSTTLCTLQSRWSCCCCCSAARWRKPLPLPPLPLPVHRALRSDGSCAAVDLLRVWAPAMLPQAAGAAVTSCIYAALPQDSGYALGRAVPSTMYQTNGCSFPAVTQGATTNASSHAASAGLWAG